MIEIVTDALEPDALFRELALVLRTIREKFGPHATLDIVHWNADAPVDPPSIDLSDVVRTVGRWVKEGRFRLGWDDITLATAAGSALICNDLDIHFRSSDAAFLEVVRAHLASRGLRMHES